MSSEMRELIRKEVEQWVGITRNRDIERSARVWMEGYDAALTYCAERISAILAQTSEARDADAARYAFLRDSVACSLSISHNDHHNMYMSVADTFDSTDGYYNDIGNDERAKMIETDTIWTLHVYPNTPVGFNVYHGSSLDAVCDAAMRQEAGDEG